MPLEQLPAKEGVTIRRTFWGPVNNQETSPGRAPREPQAMWLLWWQEARGGIETAEANASSGEARTIVSAAPGVPMKRYLVLFSALLAAWLAVSGGPQAAAETQWALLVGINIYQPQGTSAEHPAGCTYGRCELKAFQNLDGSVNDAESMADLLTSPKFGFPANQVVLLTNPAPPHPRPGVTILPASQTTRDGILAAMRKYLVDLPQKGDTVVFYDASHGSLRVNSKGTKLTVLVNGKYVHADSTLVPSDAYTGGYDIRDREMTRIFSAALDKGVHLTVIFDSCHSGSITRGIGPSYVERTLAFDPRDIDEAPDAATPLSERTDNPALIFSAAQQDQTAKELPVTGPKTEPHGVFTAALIETLEALPADTPASLVYERVKAAMESSSIPDEDPDLDATLERREQSLFGGAGDSSGKTRVAALGTNDDGNAVLQIGKATGVGVGSEFASVEPGKDGQTVKLKIVAQQGIARSTAQIVSPPGANVSPGEVFELTKWVAADTSPLALWHWPANLSEAQVLAAAAEIQASGATLVADPAEQTWTHILSWDGAHWMLQWNGARWDGKQWVLLHAFDAAPVSLGAPLTAAALQQHLPAGARLWANLPPPTEMAAKLLPQDQASTVTAAADLAGAQYALAGALTEDGPAYAWFHTSELAAGPPLGAVPPHSPGCSATSPYPVRSNWISVSDLSAIGSADEKLAHYAVLLSKVHGWLELARSPADASAATYYSLALIPTAATTPIGDNDVAQQGDQLKMALVSTDKIIEKRWVYVLDIDCHGEGQLLYPGNYTGNRFPNEGNQDRQFLLPGAPTLNVSSPYGIDTLILLSTTEPLPDPYMLNFEGVASRETRGVSSPLERLLNQTSGGTRGGWQDVPTNWGISMSLLRSVPKEAAK